ANLPEEDSTLPVTGLRQRVSLRSPVRKNRTPGSVRGASGNRRPYRDGAKSVEGQPKRALPSTGVAWEHRSAILWDTACMFLQELKADGMPTVPDIPGPYRLFFYSFDCHEPPHVHVRRERMVCKFWLTPVALSVNHGFSPRELNRIRALIVENLTRILE